MAGQERSTGTKPRRPAGSGAPSTGPTLPTGAPISSSTAAVLGDDVIAEAKARIAAQGGGAFGQEEEPKVWIGGSDDPLSVVDMKFYAQSPAQLRKFQERLALAGLLDKPRYGDYDDESFQQWRNINEQAARFYKSGKKYTPSAVLDMRVANAPEPEFDAEQGQPGTITSTTNRVDLEEQVQQAARGKLNRKLKPNEVARFVSIYQAMQKVEARRGMIAADMARPQEGVDGVDSNVVNAPSLEGSSQQFIDSQFAQEAAGEDSYDYLEALRGLLGGN